MRIPQRDRPPVPGTLPLNQDVIVTWPSGKKKRARLVAVTPGTAEVDGEVPKVFVSIPEGWGSHNIWIPRSMVSPVPLPWATRARRWLSSFLFGED